MLVGLIWVLISRIPSLANLSPLYKHRSRNVISSVENSAVKLMRGCKSLMLLMNCSRLSFVSAHTKNISSMYLFQCMGGGVCLREDSGFQCAHENIGVGRCHLCTHGCTLFLDVKFIVESEDIFVQNEF